MKGTDSTSEFKDLTDFLIKTVKKRPSVYLMDSKLSSLKIFLTGYSIAREHNQIAISDRFIDSFEVWFFTTTQNEKYSTWYHAILNECNDSEEKALIKFWEY